MKDKDSNILTQREELSSSGRNVYREEPENPVTEEHTVEHEIADIRTDPFIPAEIKKIL